MITRGIEEKIIRQLHKKKTILLFGPRQCGKTTLLKKLMDEVNERSVFLNADDPKILATMNRPNTEELRQIIGSNTLMIIDEAQRIPEIGLTAKLIHDTFPKVQLILSGSSAFELANRTHEPLTGRKRVFNLWPVSFKEYQDHFGYLHAESDLEHRLVYGFYPEVLSGNDDTELIIRDISDSYLYKDILMFANLNKPTEIIKLLKALAFQTGSEATFTELGRTCNLDPKTVERYIDILEKAYVVFKLPSFKRNLRTEIKEGKKIYFWDNGIRNAVIGQFQDIKNRNDVGALWENFLMSERMKRNSYNDIHANSYFWRTVQQQEIDYIEEVNGQLSAFEFKYSETKTVKFSKSFSKNYTAEFLGINRVNFREFLDVL